MQKGLSHEQPEPSPSYLELASPKLYHSISLPVSSAQLSSPQNADRAKLQELFNIPDLKLNKLYQKSIREVVELLSEFDRFTDNLEAKVDRLLAAQQNQFVDSYKQHMLKIEKQFKNLDEQVKRQKELIKYYENEGKMSNLVKKVAMLQNQSKRLYEIIGKKDKEIKGINLENRVMKDENKRLYAQVKEFIKNKNIKATDQSLEQGNEGESLTLNLAGGSGLSRKQNATKTLSHLNIDHHSPNNTNSYNLHDQVKFFTTEIHEQRSIKKDLSITTDEHHRPRKPPTFTYNHSEKSMASPEEIPSITVADDTRLRKEIGVLTAKVRKLAKLNAKLVEDRSELQNIFMNAIGEIKRQITVKRKIRECSYEDFAKEDKINLLLTIVSNQEILRYVYERIFGNKGEIYKQNSVTIGEGTKGKTTGLVGQNPLNANSLRKTNTNHKTILNATQLPYI